MAHITRITLVLALGLSLGSVSVPAPPPTVQRSLTGVDEPVAPHVAADTVADPNEAVQLDSPGIYGANDELAATIESAIQRFGSAGLHLPPLRIYVHGTTDGCQGHPGLYRAFGQEDRIDLCTESRFIVYHELAHAWDQQYLSDDRRESFLEHTGLRAWQGESEWGRNGIEMAANAIAAGMLLPALTEAAARDHVEELTRYAILTGTFSPRFPHPIPGSELDFVEDPGVTRRDGAGRLVADPF